MNVMFNYKKSRKEDLGNSRPVSLPWVPGKVMKQIIVTAWNVQNYQVIRSSQHKFMKDRSCLTNLISSCLANKGKAVDFVHLKFRKAFEAVSHRILLATHGLDGCTSHCEKICLDGKAIKVVNGDKSC